MKNISHTTIFETKDNKSREVLEAINSILGSTENNPDFYELQATEGRQSIGIEQTREMITWLQFKPYQSTNKLAIIRNAEQLTEQAQNSLLKTLEEPPTHSYIFLLTRNHRSLLSTILSRARLVRLKKEKGKTGLEEEKPLTEVIDAPIQEKLKWINATVGIKDPVERKNTIYQFLDEVHATIINKQEAKSRLYNLKLLETTFEGIKRNVNNKLLLENLLFNLE
ncbi:MAG: polymerase III subunit delta'' protein [candidate division WS6 bacterium GW2011_GWA2_37_6]|uniref:Polymerase III subunit delta'' protein n=1 Tax=candidate division WS6 bacterium GW2011_GWA2_37_6 TaxID=1619087 RepID=A0A0G0GT59_9BACT|nr:MAG: polymerase III subunit delta'' protein [candidate division WS6 bacterium GW2011_GWA2_37_6]